MAVEKPALSDRLQSLASGEFVWEGSESAESHGYLAGPLLRILDDLGAREVLDLGSGNGSLTARLAAPGRFMSGLDHSESGVQLARQRHPQISFDQFDILAQLPATHLVRFDAVVSAEVIEHLPFPRKLFDRAKEALLPGGTLIVTTPFHGYWKNLSIALAGKFDEHWHPLRDYGHIKFFSRRTLVDLFTECGFVDVKFRTAGRIPPLSCSMLVSGRLLL
jgi:2-polyprenyl-3-methyl-5-hydroxy-6-metoxy-1,4-benzoquinol methylase